MKKTYDLDADYEDRVKECTKLLDSIEVKEIPSEYYSELQSDFYYLAGKHIPFEMCSDGKKMERLIDLDEVIEGLERVLNSYF